MLYAGNIDVVLEAAECRSGHYKFRSMLTP